MWVRNAVRDSDLLGRAGALDHIGHRPAGGDGEVVPDLEHDRLLGGGAHRADLGARTDAHRPRGRSAEPEAHVGARGSREAQLDSEHLEQGDVERVGDARQPLYGELGHPREQLDQGQAGVAARAGPQFGDGRREAGRRFGDQLGVAAPVELHGRAAHASSSAGIT